MKQKIIFTALPNGLVKRGVTNKWAISASISLQVEDANTTLENVPDMLGWAGILKHTKFIVQLNGKPVEAKVVSKLADDVLWGNLFTKKVKVKSFVQEDLSQIPIASYPVKHILKYLKDVTEGTGKFFANDLPNEKHFTENPALTAISEYVIADFPKRGREKGISLDRLVSDSPAKNRLKSVLNKNRFIPFKPASEPMLDFAQLKNFHGMYDAKVVDKFIPLPKPEFEFHQIISALSDYPQLQRRLGLIVDLEFDGPENIIMKAGSVPTVRIVPTSINFTTDTTIVCPATAYTKTAKGFYARPTDNSIIDKGHLKINSNEFTVFQVDTDGAALKLCNQMDGLQLKKAKHIFYAVENNVQKAENIPFFNNEAPRKEGTPSHKTAGIAIAKNGRAELLHKKFDRMNNLKNLMMVPGLTPEGTTGTKASWILPNEILYADDINLGYRMDIEPDDKPGKWFSLHMRNNKYSYLNPAGTNVDISGMDTDEGFIQMAASEEKTETGTQLKVGEAIARWEGWSLSVPRPGSALNDPMLDSKEVYDKTKEAEKFKTPGTADFRLNVLPGLVEGTLPKLRFGKLYAVRIRTVDLAGNSVDLNEQPENIGETVVGKIKYMRYEPVDAPFLVLGTEIRDGESSEVMVIRSNEAVSCEQYENNNIVTKTFKPEAIRHVKPPRSNVEMSATHSVLDKGFGPANKTEAAAIYQKIKNDKDPFTAETASYSATTNLKIVDGNQKEIPVEYLIDPMAAGVTFFISAQDPNPKAPDPEKFTRRISFFFDDEVKDDATANKTADYNEWMNPKTFRIILKEEATPSLEWNKGDRALIVKLQKGVIVKVNYACFWRPNDILRLSGVLDMMGMTNLSDAVGQRIARGQHWMFSPWRELTFVHAVQQPLTKLGSQTYPFIADLKPEREFGANTAKINTKLLVHGPSTGQLDIEANWTEWLDDGEHVETTPNEWNDDVQRYPMKSKVFHFTTLYLVFEYAFGSVVKENPFPAIEHLFNDTRHRKVNYKAIATTRYREYFFNLIKDRESKGQPFPLTRETVPTAITKEVIIPSSARPLAPEVLYIIPNFEWSRNTNNSTNTTITARGAGLRVYLKRPWYSSGEGEKLAVVLNMNINDKLSSGSTPVSTWGTDPTKLSAALPGGIKMDANSFLALKEGQLQMAAAEHNGNTAKVFVVTYDVKYDKERKLYYADILLNVATAYYPFVRLALARYQHHSVRTADTDCCLSTIVMADYIQVPAPRFSSLKFEGAKNKINVGISGTLPKVDTKAMFFRTRVDFVIEPIEVDPSEGAHITIHAKPIDSYSYGLQPQDVGPNYGFLHTHSFTLPAEYASKPYRVKVLEYEVIIYDPLKPNPNPGGVNFGTMPMKERLVFADVYEVNK